MALGNPNCLSCEDSEALKFFIWSYFGIGFFFCWIMLSLSPSWDSLPSSSSGISPIFRVGNSRFLFWKIKKCGMIVIFFCHRVYENYTDKMKHRLNAGNVYTFLSTITVDFNWEINTLPVLAHCVTLSRKNFHKWRWFLFSTAQFIW